MKRELCLARWAISVGIRGIESSKVTGIENTDGNVEVRMI